MKRKLILLTISALICGTMVACGNASPPPVEETVVKEDDLGEVIYAYVEDDIKSVLKNPNSLTINNLSFNDNPSELMGRVYCSLDIDFSAQNSFGGYEREVVSYYLCYDAGKIKSFDRWSYYCELDTARYEEKLNKIDDDALLGYACSSYGPQTIHSDLLSKGVNTLTAMGSGFTDDVDNTSYIHYICDVMGFEGSMEYFFSNNKILWAEYSWYPDQGYLDLENTDFFTIGSGETATNSDMEKLIAKIDDTLGIEHEQTKSQKYQAWADPRAYMWVLSPQRKLMLEYVWENNHTGGETVINYDQVAAFGLYVKNDISE